MKQLTKLYRVCLLTVVIIFPMLPVSAQLYIADNLIGDSISVEEANLTDGIYTATAPAVYTSIANGESVKVIGFTTSEYKVENGRPVIEYNGKIYVTGRNSLKFSPENSSDVENTIQDSMQTIQHSALGHFFYTVWPFGLDGKGGTGPAPHPMVFRDKHGGVHTNGVDCDAANRRIDERANNW